MHKLAFFLLLAFIATIPLNSALALGTVGSANKFVGLAAGVAWLVGSATSGRMRRLRAFHITVIALMLWALLSLVLWSEADQSPIESLPLTALMIVMLWDSCRSARDVHDVLQAFVVGSSLAIASLMNSYRFGTSIQFQAFDVLGADIGTADRIASAGTDPNELGIMLAAAIAMAAYLMITDPFDSKWFRWLNSAFIPLGLLAVTLTGSRAAAVAAAVALLYVFATARRLPMRGRIIVVGLLILGVFAVQEFTPDLTITRILGTLGDASRGDFHTREIAWAEGLELFMENPVVGVGASAFTLNAPSGIAAHSIPVQLAAELGIVGVILFTTVLGYAIGAAHTTWRWGNGLWIALLLVWTPAALTLSWSYGKFTWFLLSMVIANRFARDGSESESRAPALQAPGAERAEAVQAARARWNGDEAKADAKEDAHADTQEPADTADEASTGVDDYSSEADERISTLEGILDKLSEKLAELNDE